MDGMVEERRRALDGVDGEQVVGEGLVVDAKLTDDVHRLLLDDYLVEHHSTAPHAATRRQLTVEERHALAGLGEIIGGHDTRWTSADDGHVERQVLLQFVEIGLDDTFRDLCLNHNVLWFFVRIAEWLL